MSKNIICIRRRRKGGSQHDPWRQIEESYDRGQYALIEPLLQKTKFICTENYLTRVCKLLCKIDTIWVRDILNALLSFTTNHSTIYSLFLSTRVFYEQTQEIEPLLYHFTKPTQKIRRRIHLKGIWKYLAPCADNTLLHLQELGFVFTDEMLIHFWINGRYDLVCKLIHTVEISFTTWIGIIVNARHDYPKRQSLITPWYKTLYSICERFTEENWFWLDVYSLPVLRDFSVVNLLCFPCPSPLLILKAYINQKIEISDGFREQLEFMHVSQISLAEKNRLDLKKDLNAYLLKDLSRMIGEYFV